MSNLLRNKSGKHADGYTGREFDRLNEDFYENDVPIIMSAENRRKAVFGAVKMWCQMFPHEVDSARRQCERFGRKWLDDGKPRTENGERFLGMVPAKVDAILQQAFNDPNYLWNNPRVIEDLSDAFAIGFPEGKARLNSADSTSR